MNNIVIRAGKHNKFFDIFTSQEGWDHWSRYQMSNGTLTHIKGRVLSPVEYKFVRGTIK